MSNSKLAIARNQLLILQEQIKHKQCAFSSCVNCSGLLPKTRPPKVSRIHSHHESRDFGIQKNIVRLMEVTALNSKRSRAQYYRIAEVFFLNRNHLFPHIKKQISVESSTLTDRTDFQAISNKLWKFICEVFG